MTSEQFSQLVDNNIPTDEIAKTEWATKPNAQGQDGVIKITFTDKDANGQPTYLNINIPASSIKITTDADKYTPVDQQLQKVLRIRVIYHQIPSTPGRQPQMYQLPVISQLQ